MKNTFKMIALALAVMTFTACQKDAPVEVSGTSLEIRIPGFPTSWLGDGPSTLALAAEKSDWAPGDALFVRVATYDEGGATLDYLCQRMVCKDDGRWLYENDIILHKNTFTLDIECCYIGILSPGNNVVGTDFLVSSLGGLSIDDIDPEEPVGMPSFERRYSRIDFIGLNEGDEITITGSKFRILSIPENGPGLDFVELTSLDYATATVDETGEATFFADLTTYELGDNYNYEINGRGYTFDRGDRNEDLNLGEYWNRRYSLDFTNTSGGTDPGSN